MIWNWWGVPGVLVLVLAWSTAGVALKLDAGRQTNRQLAGVLLLEGVYGVGNFGLLFFVTSPEAARIFAQVGAVGMAVLPLQYLVFLGASLRSPLVRPFSTRTGRFSLQVAALGAALAIVLAPGAFITDLFRPGWAPWNFTYHGLGSRMVQFHGLVSLLGLVVSIDAYRRAPPNSTTRNRAGWFIAAFGLRDAFIAAIQFFLPWLRPVPFWGDLIYNPIHGLVYAAYVLLLAYAILRHQLLDIDLRVRFVLKQSSIGMVLAGVFLVASEAIESVVPVQGVVMGVLLAVVIAAALKPAQMLAERLVTAAMPNVVPDASYMDQRRRLVLRSALENAWADGRLSDEERRLVVLLAADLGVERQEAAALESAVLADLSLKPRSLAFQP